MSNAHQNPNVVSQTMNLHKINFEREGVVVETMPGTPPETKIIGNTLMVDWPKDYRDDHMSAFRSSRDEWEKLEDGMDDPELDEGMNESAGFDGDMGESAEVDANVDSPRPARLYARPFSSSREQLVKVVQSPVITATALYISTDATPPTESGSPSHAMAASTPMEPLEEVDSDIIRRLKDVLSTGSQFADMPSQIKLKADHPGWGFKQRIVLALVSVSIDGRQLNENGSPRLCDMGWTFKWRLVHRDPSTVTGGPSLESLLPLKAKVLPVPGTHNLIHVGGQIVEKGRKTLHPIISAYGVSGEVGTLQKEAEPTDTEFTTFQLTGTLNPGNLAWRWKKIQINIRDPTLTYSFSFRFTFEEPFPVKDPHSGISNALHSQGDNKVAVEITLCDLDVTLERKYPFFSRPVTLKYPRAAWDNFRSDECDVPLDEIWPIFGTAHLGCSKCRSVSLPV